MINRSRFESFIGFSEPAAQLRLCNLSFTNAAVPQGVREGQVLVKRRVTQGRDGGGLVQRLKRDTPLIASSYGQTGLGSFPGVIMLRSGSAAYDVGTPRVSPPRSGGKTYFSPCRRNSSSALKFGRFFR